MNTHAVLSKSEARDMLQSPSDLCIIALDMAQAADILKLVGRTLVADAKKMKELTAKMAELTESYNLYLDCQRQYKQREKSVHGLKALLGPEAYVSVMRADRSDTIGEDVDTYPHAGELREKAQLWEHVAQYLRFVSEAQVGEIVEFLGWLGVETTRQSVESCVRHHPKSFALKKRGRERFISLKGV
jgi:HrpA-like RNA helicase